MSIGLETILPNLFFFFLDLVILIHMFKNRETTSSRTLFTHFIICVLLQQGAVVVTTSCDYGLLRMGEVWHYTLTILSLTFMNGATYFCLRYMISTVHTATKEPFYHILIYLIPTFFYLIACVLSPWTHWVFYIGENHTYQNGSLSYLPMVCPIIYFMVSVWLVFHGLRVGLKNESLKAFYNYVLFTIPVVIGYLLNNYFVRGGYTQIGISFGLILLYLEQYMDEINENKRLRAVDRVNTKLQKANEELELHISEIEDLNELLKSNQEKLEQRYSIIQSMGSIYFAAYYIDLANDTYVELKTTDNIHQVISEIGGAQKSFFASCEELIMPDHKSAMMKFFDLSTIRMRLRDKNAISQKYEGIKTGWSIAYFIAGERDEKGLVKHVFYAVRNFHDEHEKEEEQNRILQEAKREADEANEAKTTFLFNMSHDIRTPMNAIMGFRDLLEKNQEDPKKRADYLQKIEESSNILLSIINNVLEMSRIEKGKIEIEEAAWGVEQFHDALYSIFQEMMTEKGIIYKRSIQVENSYILCDSIKVREIFINLISNAYKYTNTGGTVSVSLKELPCEREGYALYETTVSDTGIGMSEDFLPHLFDEFSRENTTTISRIEGTGLGMPIVKRLVELMDGTIKVKSKKDVGTTFVVTIPHKICSREDVTNVKEISVDPSLFAGKRILLVEDNELNAEIATEILEDEGFLVEHAEDGEICINMLRERPEKYYDLILMDIQMPNMNGYEATKVIRSLSDQEKASITILAMTANAFEEDKKNAFEAGMDGHIAKPIDVAILFEELARVLSKDR